MYVVCDGPRAWGKGLFWLGYEALRQGGKGQCERSLIRLDRLTRHGRLEDQD